LDDIEFEKMMEEYENERRNHVNRKCKKDSWIW
jgi:hypothetical protein